MMKKTTAIYIVAFLFFFQSCGTIFYKRNVEKENRDYLKEVLPNSIIRGDLVGVWISQEMWLDAGIQYKRLEIRNSGRVIYTPNLPNLELSNSKSSFGNYRTLSDTLIISFDRNKDIVWMKYKLDAGTLYLYNINYISKEFGGIWKRFR